MEDGSLLTLTTFGGDLDKDTHPEMFPYITLTLRDGVILKVFINFSGNSTLILI